MSSGFYRAFEDRYRGSRELILGRLEIYLPFVEKLKVWHTPCNAIDLGCGRGEWLQFLQKNGMQARGVDLDKGMLQACHELNLQAEQSDAKTALQSLPDNSLSIVSGFHLVEHIEFSQVQQLAEQAFRVLKPGGLLILETPNAENLLVGANNFYLDPTHIRPVPNLLLSFITEKAGFYRNKVLRLQEDPALHQLHRPRLVQVLTGVSPDYAVVAQKPAADELMKDFDPIFAVEYGISINHIAERYEQGLQAELDNIKDSMEALSQKEQRLGDRLFNAAERAIALSQNNHNLTPELYKSELRAAQSENLAEQVREQLLQATQRLQQEEARTSKFETELRQVSIHAAQLEARYEISKNQLQLQGEQHNQIHQQLIEKTQRIQEFQYQLHAREKQLSEISKEFSVLSEQLSEATDQISSLKNQAEVNAEALEKKLTDRLSEKISVAQEQHVEELKKITEQFNQTTQHLNDSLGNAHHWHLQANKLETELNSKKAELHTLQHANHQNWTQLHESQGNAHHWYERATYAEQQNAAAQQHINDLLRSTSWRISAPLRVLRVIIGWLLALPLRAIKALLRPLINVALRYVINRPAMRQRWANRLRKYPKVFAHLRQFAINKGLIAVPPTLVPPGMASVQDPASLKIKSTPPATAAERTQPATIETQNLDDLTPSAKQMYHDLKAAIAKNKEHQ